VGLPVEVSVKVTVFPLTVYVKLAPGTDAGVPIFTDADVLELPALLLALRVTVYVPSFE
jgi:hypothetical protein